jgi:hypothetical protein
MQIAKMWSRRPRPRTEYSKTRAGRRTLAHFLAVSALLLTLTSASAAQRTSAPAHVSAPHSHLPTGNYAIARRAHSSFRRSSPYGPGYSPGYPGYASLPFPFFDDNFDPNDVYSTGYPVASRPPPFLMQALQGLTNPAVNSMATLMNTPGTQDSSSNGPLMIELQNGRYVRVNHTANDEAQPLAFANDSPAAKPHIKLAKPAPENPTPQTVAAAQLPAVVLIFRDGHSEQVRDYSIAQGTLYARGNYYTDGYWNKKIDLATLNVADTLQANSAHNVNFVLPSSPNEVITRP